MNDILSKLLNDYPVREAGHRQLSRGWLYEGRIALSTAWIAIFSTFVKLAVDRYNLRLRFGIYKLKFLRSIQARI